MRFLLPVSKGWVACVPEVAVDVVAVICAELVLFHLGSNLSLARHSVLLTVLSLLQYSLCVSRALLAPALFSAARVARSKHF